MLILIPVNGGMVAKQAKLYIPSTANSKAFKKVSRQALKNAMYCHLKSYSCTSSGARILPESRNLWQYPYSTTASTGLTL